jgi:hypothetical protein
MRKCRGMALHAWEADEKIGKEKITDHNSY